MKFGFNISIFLCLICDTYCWWNIWRCRLVSWQTNFFGELIANEFSLINTEDYTNSVIMMSSDDHCLEDLKTHTYSPSISLYTRKGAVVRTKDNDNNICLYLERSTFCNNHYDCFELANENIYEEKKGEKKIEASKESIGKFEKGTKISKRFLRKLPHWKLYQSICNDIATYRVVKVNSTDQSLFTWVNTLLGQIEFAGLNEKVD